jgi:hypothetical protein
MVQGCSRSTTAYLTTSASAERLKSSPQFPHGTLRRPIATKQTTGLQRSDSIRSRHHLIKRQIFQKLKKEEE